MLILLLSPLGDTSLSPVLATVCGREVPGPIRSSGDTMFIHFTADASITGFGFNASYHKSKCFLFFTKNAFLIYFCCYKLDEEGSGYR